MKGKEGRRVTYEAPNTNIIGIGIEGVLCQSPDWHQKGGEGDFSYGVENENKWA